MEFISGTTVIIFILIAIICIILLFFINTYNKFQNNLIKLEKAKTTIDYNLDLKKTILKKFIDFLSNNLNIAPEEFDKYFKKDNSSVEMDLNFNKCFLDIKKNMDNHEKLAKKEQYITLLTEIRDIDICLNGCKKFYNNTLIDYNKLTRCFPTKLCALIFRYKEENFYKEKITNDLKILVEEDN